jgi:hypothetical protein
VDRLAFARLTAASLVLAALLAAAPADARVRRLHFTASVKGHQTVIWQQVFSAPGADPCASTATSRGSQTISFESPRRGRLLVAIYSRRLAVGGGQVPADWTFDRQFSQSQTDPACIDPSLAEQPSPPCGRQGPFHYYVGFRYDGRKLEIGFAVDIHRPGTSGPRYGTCEYEAYHNAELIDTRARLPLKALLRHRSFRLHFARRLNENDPQNGVSQTTTLSADVTLRRVR